jgi:hypothetical protein
MKRFTSVRLPNGSCQPSAASLHTFGHDGTGLSASGWRTEMAERFAVWNQVTELDTAA